MAEESNAWPVVGVRDLSGWNSPSGHVIMYSIFINLTTSTASRPWVADDLYLTLSKQGFIESGMWPKRSVANLQNCPAAKLGHI